MQTPDNTIIQKAREAFILSRKDYANTGGSPTCTVYEESNSILLSPGCYGGFKSTGPSKKLAAFAGMQRRTSKSDQLSEEETAKYLEYLFTDFPLRHAFKPQDISLIMRDKIVEMDVTSPGNHLLGALFAFRYIWERSYTVQFFLRLRQEGVEANLAFLLASCVRMSRTGVGEDSFNFGTGHSGHTLLMPNSFNMINCAYFIKGELRYTSPPFVESASCLNTNAIFNSKKDSYYDTGELPKFIQKHFSHKDQVDTQVFNPFMEAKKSLEQPKGHHDLPYITEENMIRQILVFIPKLIDRIKGDLADGYESIHSEQQRTATG